MDLTPSERAVLAQIRDLFLEGSVRSYRFSVLTGRWPVTHYDAYRSGFVGLVEKGLIAKGFKEQSFNITNAGMRAMV